MKRVFIWSSLLFCLALLSLPVSSYAFNYGDNGAGGGTGITGGGSGSGGTVALADIRHAENGTLSVNSGSATTYCKSLASAMTNATTKLPKGSPTADNARKICAARIADVLLGASNYKSIQDQSDWANFTGLACSASTKAKASSACWRSDPKNIPFGSVKSFYEIHKFSPDVADDFETMPGGVVALNVLVWRWDGAGKATKVFARQVEVTNSSQVSANFTDDGGCTKKGNRGCITENDWWAGGNKSNAYWWNSTPKGGPLSNPSYANSATQNARTASCQSDWSNGGAAELQAAKGSPYGSKYQPMYPGQDLGDYITNIGSASKSNPIGSYQKCFWTISSNASPQAYYNDAGTDKSSYADSLHDSFAFAYNIPRPGNGGTSFYYRLQGHTPAVYIVQVYGVDSRENITSEYVRAYAGGEGNPAGTGCTTNCNLPNTSTTGGVDPGDDQTEFISDLFDDGAILFDGAQSPDFPTLNVSLTSTSSVPTGQVSTWMSHTNQDGDLLAGQVLWVTGATLSLAEPQVFANKWQTTMNGQPYYSTDKTKSAFYIKAQSGNSQHSLFPSRTNPYFDIDTSWPLTNIDTSGGPTNGSARSSLSYSTRIAQTTFNGTLQGSPLLDQGYSVSSLLPSQTEDDPMLGIARIQYESGRYYNDFSKNDDGQSCTSAAQWMRAGKSVPHVMAGDVSSQIAQGYFVQNSSGCSGITHVVLNTTATPYQLSLTNRDTGTVTNFGATKQFTLGGLADGQYLVTAYFNNIGKDTSWTMQVTTPHDSRDFMQWAGQDNGDGRVYGPDFDPSHDIQLLPQTACYSGYCTENSNYSATLFVGNQPSQ